METNHVYKVVLANNTTHYIIAPSADLALYRLDEYLFTHCLTRDTLEGIATIDSIVKVGNIVADYAKLGDLLPSYSVVALQQVDHNGVITDARSTKPTTIAHINERIAASDGNS